MNIKFTALCFPVLLGAFVTNDAFAQRMRPQTIRSGSIRSFSMSLPVLLMNRDLPVRGEYNLNGEATLGLEFTMVRKSEEYGESEVEKNGGRSLVSEGFEMAAFFTRYSNPFKMSGFYVSLGAGYRKLDATFKAKPDKEEYGLVNPALLDEQELYTHDMTAAGTTGHGRLGYRYIVESFPMLLGGYFGLRHFENKFEHNDPEAEVLTTEEQRQHLKSLVMTRPELGIEFGFAF